MGKKILVVASGNKGKIKEIAEMFPEVEVKGYTEYADFEIEENGKDFYENALIKAKAVANALNVSALADDSGLCVSALNGAPGIYSARYSGKGDKENIETLLKNMEGKKDRSAKFVCCMVYYSENGEILTAFGETEGEISTERIGENGFGYDPVFISKDLNKSLGKASFEEKNSISHRARALKEMKKLLKEKGII